MEKLTPHYKLSKVQQTVADPENQPFTITALRGGLELGLMEQEMRPDGFHRWATAGDPV
jgi:hypothetical protein